MNRVGCFIHIQRVSAHEMHERALCGRMPLDPFDLIGIDGDFLSAAMKRDHLGHSCHLAEVTIKPKIPAPTPDLGRTPAGETAAIKDAQKHRRRAPHQRKPNLPILISSICFSKPGWLTK